MNLLTGARRALLPLGLAASLATPAMAQGFNLTAATIATALKDAGFTAEIQQDEDGLPDWVKGYSSTVKASFEARFDSCDEDGEYCDVLVFSAGFNFGNGGKALPLEKINEWNTNHFGKSYVIDNTMWVSTELSPDGITKNGLDATVNWFGILMSDYVGFIGWKAS